MIVICEQKVQHFIHVTGRRYRDVQRLGQQLTGEIRDQSTRVVPALTVRRW